MAIIIHTRPRLFEGSRNRYIHLDKFSYNGDIWGIAPKYIDIEYQKRSNEMEKIYKSHIVSSGTALAGKIILGNCKEDIKNKNSYPVLESDYVIHTMIDRIDSWKLFKKWLLRNKRLGFSAISIGLNVKDLESNSSRMLVGNLVEACDSVFEKTLITIWPFEHRYKPCFEDIKYIGNENIMKDFLMYAPGNFHHIQHIAMKMCTYQIRAKWYGFIDVDEFIDPSIGNKDLMYMIDNSKYDCIYFMNKWHYIVDELNGLAIPMGSKMNVGSRSKYIVKAGAVDDYGIHIAKLGADKTQYIAGNINHLINLSSYSGRSSKKLKQIAEEMNLEIDIRKSVSSIIEL